MAVSNIDIFISAYGAQKVDGAFNQITNSIKNLKTGMSTLRSANGDVDKLKEGFGALSNAGQGLTLAGAGMAGFMTMTVNAAGAIERQTKTFEVLLGSASKAKDMVKWLSDRDSISLFDKDAIVDAGRALTAFGMDVKQYLPLADDLAAGMGKSLAEVVPVFGRLKSGDFGEAFERLRDFGISRQLLEDNGLKGKFDSSNHFTGTSDEALAAVEAIIKKRFGGLSEKLGATTWEGAVSSFSSNMQRLKETLGTALLPTFTAFIQKVNTFTKGFADFAAKNPGLMKVLGTLSLVTAGFLLVTGPLLMIVGTIGSAAAGFTAIGGGLTALSGGIAALSGGAGLAGLAASIGAMLPVIGAAVIVLGGAYLVWKKYSDELAKPTQTADHTLDSSGSEATKANIEKVLADPTSSTEDKMRALKAAQEAANQQHDYDAGLKYSNQYKELRRTMPKGEEAAQKISAESRDAKFRTKSSVDNGGNTTITVEPIKLPPSQMTRDFAAAGA